LRVSDYFEEPEELDDEPEDPEDPEEPDEPEDPEPPDELPDEPAIPEFDEVLEPLPVLPRAEVESQLLVDQAASERVSPLHLADELALLPLLPSLAEDMLLPDVDELSEEELLPEFSDEELLGAVEAPLLVMEPSPEVAPPLPVSEAVAVPLVLGLVVEV
jgi:hypothetical protein